ncbi:MAG: diacylglycerol kinase family protein [Acidimicrobiia bacterium]|nr:diacylglycerol kinase family protein [Acidimicrobiia bacterium]
MQRLVLVANPIASGFTASLHREVVTTLTGPFDVTPVWPGNAAGARSAAEEAAREGYDVVVAMGGDGVAHQVANGLLGSRTALGIVPAGTTNVLARLLGLPTKPSAAAGLIADRPGTREIPVAAVATDSVAGVRSHVALFNVGAGFDADVVARVERRPLSKVSFGALHYALATAATLIGDYRRREPDLRVTVDGTSADGVAALVQVQDTYTYFGRLAMRLGPGGDGLTVAVVERLPVLRALRTTVRALGRRGLGGLRGIELVEGARRIEIRADDAYGVQADGEHLGETVSATVTASETPLVVVAG